MKKELFTKYAEIKSKIDSLKKESDELKGEIQGDMSEEGFDTIESEFGTFSLTEYPNYKYGAEVEKLEERLKNKKAKEREDGTAENNPKVVLRFTPRKNDSESTTKNNS